MVVRLDLDEVVGILVPYLPVVVQNDDAVVVCTRDDLSELLVVKLEAGFAYHSRFLLK